MNESPSLPAKRTIGSHKGTNNQRSQSPRKPAKRNHSQSQRQGESNKTSSKPSNSKDGSSNRDIKNANTEPICDICVQNVPGPEREKIYAFGKCDHQVCYVCSARLRAICDQPECPICREKLESVIFSANKDQPYDKHDIANYILDEKYRIYFENSSIQEAFMKLLKFECLKCLNDSQAADNIKKSSEQISGTNVFPDVLKLKQHLYFTHKLKLCDLCLTHNKLFPHEYSYYDKISLSKHLKAGEPNTSHRGHPQCELCSNTFFNQDDLLQHMSREHYHCHLCGRHNSTMHIYFLDYASLRLHFKSEHYLCERGNCRYEQFTSAFDSQIDYKLHIADVHGGSANASRGETRQQRTITLDSAPHRPASNRNQPNVPRNAAVVSTGTLATANASDPRRQIPESFQAQMQQQRMPSRSEFPTLGNDITNSLGAPTSQSVTVSSTSATSQFPSLVTTNPRPTSRTVPTSYRITAGPSSSRSAFNLTAGGGAVRPAQLDQMDFPPLPEQPKPKGAKSRKQKPMDRNENLTLDQLISNNLVLSSRGNSGKSKSNKTSKSAKQKPLKFQL